mmetsp:Transcript_35200/g.69376  ORF Transcript_35200/g.69376 Transcript_35200/m.69376 type:complete len:352 (-) Transcript_35200:404-1459(-)|eukprot:CAMPEP_0194334718 /NCGR_PEP_ID=MMETSP0171-20130528/67066_1 /TAXON_ID=218684 /ORGANISM="Corethron pennatum, Strain L29A3" /LENGTH=351 /DNA_ID=CAMNT_0039097497 /DNA_START=389 /DNA_END=1444 /DNA_ORIENTATION=+
MSLQQQPQKKKEQKLPTVQIIDPSVGLPGVAVPETTAWYYTGNTASPYEIFNFLNNRPASQPEGTPPPKYLPITPMGFNPSPSLVAFNPVVCPSRQPVAAQSIPSVPGGIKHYPGRMTPEERRARSNAQSRLRAIEKRTRIQALRQKTVHSTEEKNLLETFEKQRNRKNARSRQRAVEKKAELERILSTPLSKRTDRDFQISKMTLEARRKKNEGEMERREKIKQENIKNNIPPRQRGPPRKYHPKPEPSSVHFQAIQLKSQGILPVEKEGPDPAVQAIPGPKYSMISPAGQISVLATPGEMLQTNNAYAIHQMSQRGVPDAAAGTHGTAQPPFQGVGPEPPQAGADGEIL